MTNEKPYDPHLVATRFPAKVVRRNTNTAEPVLSDHPCQAIIFHEDRREPGGGYRARCGKRDKDKPMAFRGEDWCCGKHRQTVEEQGSEASRKR